MTNPGIINLPLVRQLFVVLAVILALSVNVTRASQSINDFGGEEFIFLTWSEYIDPEVVTAFEKKFNAKVKFAYFETDDKRTEMLVTSEGRGYDLVLTSGHDLEKYVNQGWIEPLGVTDVPNLRHINSRWAKAFPKTETHAVPYFWGTLGIAYRKDLVSEPITSWNSLLNPPEELRGKIVMNGFSRDVMAVALKALGYSINTSDRTELKQAEELLQKQKPYVKSYSYVVLSEESALVKGEIWASMIYSGDALMLQEHSSNIAYAVPEEGGNIWVDYISILSSSTKKKLAAAFLNFLNEPKIAAQNAEYVYYATPNMAAESHLPQEYFDNLVIYPPEEQLSKSEFYRPLSPRAEKLTNNIVARLFLGKTEND